MMQEPELTYMTFTAIVFMAGVIMALIAAFHGDEVDDNDNY